MSDKPEIIDMHIHLCRDVQQEKTVFPKTGWPDGWYWANPKDVIPYMDARGVSHVATMNIIDTTRMVQQRIARAQAQGASESEIAEARATLGDDMRERVRAFNDLMCEASQKEPRIITYVMADPILFGKGVADEVERCIAKGAKGIKVHPSICGHFPDDENMRAVYDLCQSAGLGVLTDSTSRVNSDGNAYGMPLGWRPVLQAYPRLKFIMAHLCDVLFDDRLDMAREFSDNLWFDMSGGIVDAHHPAGGHAMLGVVQAPRVFRKIGVERIMFGSDGPGGGRGEDILEAAGEVMRLALTDAEKEQILAGNAKRFFGLK